ncbi:MAG: pyridoxal-phosphate dependent enzyme [Actinomycetota bacterium]
MSVTEAVAANPFIRYRWLLDSYRSAIGRGWSDSGFVALVERLDNAIAEIDGHGFTVTPLTRHDRLGAAVGLGAGRLWVKDDTANVGASHKARHLFGVLLHLAIQSGDEEGELAIASCGNAALAAAVVARAAVRRVRVFVPTWADPVIVDALEDLEAVVEICERRAGEIGDPTFLRLKEAVGSGAVPFSVQSTVTPTALDGGRTIGWELAEQLALARVTGVIRLVVQVGGGALAAATWQGINDGINEQWLEASPVLDTVQTDAVAPLNRAWGLLRNARQPDGSDWSAGVMDLARAAPASYMWPWEEVGSSIATGILDDLTYDWLPVMEAMLRSGGRAIVVSEALIEHANHLARAETGIEVDPTGSAGVAALLDASTRAQIGPDDHVVVLFTGRSQYARAS